MTTMRQCSRCIGCIHSSTQGKIISIKLFNNKKEERHATKIESQHFLQMSKERQTGLSDLLTVTVIRGGKIYWENWKFVWQMLGIDQYSHHIP